MVRELVDELVDRVVSKEVAVENKKQSDEDNDSPEPEKTTEKTTTSAKPKKRPRKVLSKTRTHTRTPKHKKTRTIVAADDPEVWKSIQDCDAYEVSSYGRIKSFRQYKTGRILKQHANLKGYMSVNVSGKQQSVHRFVATAFHPNPNNLRTVDHLDGNPSNNHVSNLRWASHKQQLETRRKPHKRVGRAINRICSDTGAVLQTYASIIEAARWCTAKNLSTKSETGTNCAIRYAAKQETRRALGFKWSYPDQVLISGEVWKPVSPLFPKAHGYDISSFGRIKSKTGNVLKGYMVSTGYMHVKLFETHFSVHRLVAYTFLKNNDLSLCVNHLDSNRCNNRLDNLEICSRVRNSRHALEANRFAFAKPVQVVDKQTGRVSQLPSIQCGVKLATMSYGTVSKRLTEYGVYEDKTVRITLAATKKTAVKPN